MSKIVSYIACISRISRMLCYGDYALIVSNTCTIDAISTDSVILNQYSISIDYK